MAPKRKSGEFWWSQVDVGTNYRPTEGGCRSWKCRYCGIDKYSACDRVRYHLLGIAGKNIKICPLIPTPMRESLKQKDKEEDESRGIRRLAANTNPIRSTSPSPCNTPHTFFGSSSGSGAGPSGSGFNQATLKSTWNPQHRGNVDQDVGRFFWMCNIPFYAAESPYFKTMVKGIANFGPTYDPPSSKIIGGRLLMKEEEDIEAAIEPIREGWFRNGCSLIGDGWSDVRRRPLQGLIVSSRGKSFFIKTYDSSGHQKTSENLVAIWADGIDYVGASNVVQFISDSEASNKRAGMLLESRYPHLFWTPCVAHSLNNLMKDIGALPWIAPTIQKGRDVVTFIYRHHYSLALYRRLASKELLKYVETRFAYNFLMLQRLFDMRHELRQLVVSSEWVGWENSKSPICIEVTSSILCNEFWTEVELVISVVGPINKMMRLVDGDTPCMGKVYEGMDRVIEHIQGLALDESKITTLKEMCIKRWDQFHVPLYAAAYILDPEFQGKGQERDREVFRGWEKVLDRLIPMENHRKVGDVASQGLGESVSFGRFVADSSSTWRRRSSFHHNQYLEELGSFSSTGSVAQKKAYFEAYYKALAEKKASEREILIGSSIVSGLGTKKDPDIHLLKSSSTTIEGEKLGNTTSNMIDLEIRESQVDQHCVEDKDPIRSSNIDILTKKTEVSSLNLFKKSCGTDLPLDFSPKGQCSEIKSSIVIVLMKEKESQVVQEEHSEEIAMPMPSFEMSAIPEENLAISSGLEEEYYVATDSPCSIVEYENIFEKKREMCITEISGDAEHQKEKEDEEFLESPVGKEYTIENENVNALSETLDAKRILDANDSNSLETRPDLSLPRFDTSSKPGKDSSIPSQEDEYTTEFSPSLRIEENVEVSGEINSMQNSVNKKHEQDKEENEFDSDSEALSTNSTHSTITLSEVLDEKNLNSKNPDVAEKFEGPQLKEIVNGQIMKTTKTKDHVSRSVKYSQLFLSNKKPSLEEKIVKNKGMTKDKNEERSVSTRWVGGSRSKFTVPQPFSLETGKRALALSLSQSVIPRPMSKTRQTSSCPSLQLLKQTQVPFKQENKSFDAKRFQRELPMKSDGYTRLFPSQKKQDRDEDRSFPALQELSPINESTRSPTKVQAFSLHTNVRAEKRKEFNARLQAKLNANDLEKCELQSKTKVNSKVEAKMNNTKGKENSHPSITKVNSKVEAKMNNTKGKENANPSFTKEEAETEVKKTKNPLSERVSLVPRVYHELAPSKRATKMEEAETEVKKTQNPLSERVSILPWVNHEPSPSKRASKMMAIPHANTPKLVRKSREPCAGISGTLPKLKDDSLIHKLQNKANASGERNNNRSMQSKETSGKLMGLGERLSSGKLRVLETQTGNDNPSNIHPKGKEEIRESSHGNINHRKASKEVTKQFIDSGGNTKLVDASMKGPKTNIVKKEMTNKPFFPASFNFSKREVAMQPILLVHHPRSTRMHGLIPATQLVLAS